MFFLILVLIMIMHIMSTDLTVLRVITVLKAVKVIFGSDTKIWLKVQCRSTLNLTNDIKVILIV